MALLSGVIPTKNRSDQLKRAINSVINQSYKTIEVIVVDDYSSDITDELIESIKSSS